MFWSYSFLPLFHLLAIAAFVWLVIAIMRAAFPHRHHGPHRRDAAMELLRERYVKGEVTRDEFNAKKADLLD